MLGIQQTGSALEVSILDRTLTLKQVRDVRSATANTLVRFKNGFLYLKPEVLCFWFHFSTHMSRLIKASQLNEVASHGFLRFPIHIKSKVLIFLLKKEELGEERGSSHFSGKKWQCFCVLYI